MLAHVERCSAAHNKFSIFMPHNLTEMRQLSLEMSCWEVGRILTRLNISPFDFVLVLVRFPRFFASKCLRLFQ